VLIIWWNLREMIWQSLEIGSTSRSITRRWVSLGDFLYICIVLMHFLFSFCHCLDPFCHFFQLENHLVWFSSWDVMIHFTFGSVNFLRVGALLWSFGEKYFFQLCAFKIGFHLHLLHLVVFFIVPTDRSHQIATQNPHSYYRSVVI
jgi:hypothetical protein